MNKGRVREFKEPEKDIEINDFSKKKFAPQSRKKIQWAVNLFELWRSSRMSKSGTTYQIIQCDLRKLNGFCKRDLCYALCRFMREVKKIDGTEHPPNTIRELVIMIQMYLHENQIYWKLLDQEEFLELRNVVDNTMKQHHSQGLGMRKTSDVISLKHEDKLFTDGILGNDNPMKLLHTTMYMIGLHCALRGGVEHNNLRRPGCDSQFNFELDGNGVERLVYREDPLQKNNQGGLECKSKPKTVFIYEASNKARCPISIFKKYIGLLPESKSCRKMYLRCRKNPTPSVWYCDQPYGVNRIKANVKEICKEGGIVGNYSNHSLRATCASRMYDQNVPEQIIKKVTGHRSDCVRVYKRTGDGLKRAASGVIAGEVGLKRCKIEEKVKEIGTKTV